MNRMLNQGPDARDLQDLWLQHKTLLHQLYISENKTLKQVKRVMEMVHGFPALRLHDYEVAIREVLKLRKNLKKEDWYTIGVRISNRKRQGKKTEVLWNNKPMAAKRVRKEILRNRSRRQFRTANMELPVGLIVRTPPGSPSAEQLAMALSAGGSSDPESIDSMSHLAVPGVYQGELSTCNIQVALPATDRLAASKFHYLRQDLPYNRFMSEILGLANSYPSIISLSAGWNWTPGPRLLGGNPSLDVLARMTYQLSNKMDVNWKSVDNRWFLDWFSLSADFGLLRTFFSINTPTACAVYEELGQTAFNLQKPALARVLVEVKETVNTSNVMNVPGNSFLAIAVRAGSQADGMLDLAKRALRYISPWAIPGRPAAQIPDLFMLAAAQGDMAMLRLLAGTTDGTSHIHLDLFASVMRRLFTWNPEETRDDGTIFDYVQLLVHGGILLMGLRAESHHDLASELPIEFVQSFTMDEIVMMCPPTRRQYLYSVILCCSNEHQSILTKAGMFTAAIEGTQNLLEYLQSCNKKGTLDNQATMQECLLFAATLNDTTTASALLELGVDPDIDLLSGNRARYRKGIRSWSPMIVAAASGNLEMLQLLRERTDLASFIKWAPVHEIIQGWDVEPESGSRLGWELGRLDILRCLFSQARDSDMDFAGGIRNICEFRGRAWMPSRFSPIDNGQRIGTLTYIRNIAVDLGVAKNFDEEIINIACFDHPEARYWNCRHATYHPCDVLLLDGLVDTNLDYREGDMDLLQLSIHAQCTLEVVEFLLSKGFRVHSKPAAQSGNTMLHDALLSQSHDRSQIVHLLVREGADFKDYRGGQTILEASLQVGEPAFDGKHPGQPGYEPNWDIFTYLLGAGAPVQSSRLKVQESPLLICQLLAGDADEDLIYRVLDAGADLNGRARCHVSQVPLAPLESAIRDGREQLAQELIRRGADAHLPADGVGTLTALQTACFSDCSLHFIEYLIQEQGVDVHEAPAKSCGSTALQGAARCGSLPVVEILLAYGADVNEAPAQYSGFTALQGAASCGSLSVVEILLAHGADLNALGGNRWDLDYSYGDPWTQRKSCRRRALDDATEAGRLDMVEFLLKAGGRSGVDGLGGAIAIAKGEDHSAILSVLLHWEQENGSVITKEEAEWLEKNPDSARMLLDPERDSEFSSDSASVSEYSLNTDSDD